MKHNPSFEELLWSCSCGTPMGLEINSQKIMYDLDCRICGLIGTLIIRFDPRIRQKQKADEIAKEVLE